MRSDIGRFMFQFQHYSMEFFERNLKGYDEVGLSKFKKILIDDNFLIKYHPLAHPQVLNFIDWYG